MKYLSLFSGIEAFSQAVHDFGWTCVGVSEIDPFASEVLKQRLPTVQNLGDITKITKEKLNELKESYEGIDLVVGGSPCQSFSVAGLRKGLEDPRGNLMLEYVRVVATVRPSWFIWENVPGALSSGKGQDFGTFLQAMAQLGYNLGWRVLDAQHFGVPQRRRRVFLIGSLNKKDGPFKVLFERQSIKGDITPSSKKGQSDTSETKESVGKHGKTGGGGRGKEKGGARKVSQKVTMLESNQKHATMGDMSVSPTLNAARGKGGGHVPMILEESIVVDQKCFTQNTREEVRYIGGDGETSGGLSASQGSHQTNYIAEYYEHHPNDSRVKGPKVVGSSVTARYGTGGGNVPLVLERQEKNHVYWLKTLRTGGECERSISPALTAQTGDTLPTVIDEDMQKSTVEVEIYRKSKNARSVDDHETWVKDEKTNTLAAFYSQPNIAIIEHETYREHDFPNFTKDTVAAPLRVACPTSTLTIEHEMEHELCSTLCARDYKGPSNDDFTASSQKLVLEHQREQQQQVRSSVRKLTPMECERLQGFPDDYTRIAYRKKTADKCPHSPRYKALGNSMAVPVMRWIACRIALVEGVLVPSFRPISVEKKKPIQTFCIQGDIAEGKRMGQNGIGFKADVSYTLQAHSGTTPAVVVEEES
jgi:DNA (cytosine-5)-methyltransferase 1